MSLIDHLVWLDISVHDSSLCRMTSKHPLFFTRN